MRYLVKKIPSTSLVQYDGSRYYCEIAGGTAEKSTVDTTGLLAGSKYLDVQTGTWYVYDELTNAWAVSAEGGSADPAVVEAAVEAWLDAHPEATTTVQDGSITYAKLDSTLKGKADAVATLSDEIDAYGNVILMPPLVGFISYNTTSKVLTIPSLMRFIRNGVQYEPSGDKTLDLSGISTSAIYIYYDIQNATYIAVPYSSANTYNNKNYILLFAVRKIANACSMSVPFPYKVNDIVYQIPYASTPGTSETQAMTQKAVGDYFLRKSDNVNMALIICGNEFPMYSTTDRTLTFSAKTTFISDGYIYDTDTGAIVSIPYDDTSVIVVVLQKSTNTLSAIEYGSFVSLDKTDYLVVCAIRTDRFYQRVCIDIGIPYYVDGNLFALTEDHGTNFYYGNRISLSQNGVNVAQYFAVQAPSGYGQQDMAIYGNYLIVGHNNSTTGDDQIDLYNLNTQELITTYATNIQHGNVIQFSNEFYDASDTLPLVYSGYAGKVNIIRLMQDGTATVIKTLSFPSSDFGYHGSYVFNFDQQICYAFGYHENTYTAGTANYIEYSICDMKRLTENGDGTFTPAVLEKKDIPYFGTMQGAEYYKGKIYFLTASVSSPFNPKMNVIEPLSGDIVSYIDSSGLPSGLADTELEGIAIKQGANKVVMCIRAYRMIYTFDFI